MSIVSALFKRALFPDELHTVFVTIFTFHYYNCLKASKLHVIVVLNVILLYKLNQVEAWLPLRENIIENFEIVMFKKALLVHLVTFVMSNESEEISVEK